MPTEAEQLCPQCWKDRPASSFIGKRGLPVNWCSTCRGLYGNWSAKTQEEKDAIPRVGVPALEELRVAFYAKSGNRKLGGIPTSITSRNTCPPSCGMFEAGCFAETHVLAHHWRRVGRSGGMWQELCDRVAALPEGQLWRHNTAGDLPGDGEVIDVALLEQLVAANRGRRGFSFSHKRVRARPGNRSRGAALDLELDNAMAIRSANRAGFVVNLSADGLAHADSLARLEVAPVVAVVPSDAPRSLHTPPGDHLPRRGRGADVRDVRAVRGARSTGGDRLPRAWPELRARRPARPTPGFGVAGGRGAHVTGRVTRWKHPNHVKKGHDGLRSRPPVQRRQHQAVHVRGRLRAGDPPTRVPRLRSRGRARSPEGSVRSMRADHEEATTMAQHTHCSACDRPISEGKHPDLPCVPGRQVGRRWQPLEAPCPSPPATGPITGCGCSMCERLRERRGEPTRCTPTTRTGT